MREMEWERKCFGCGGLITLCFGFIKAGDMMEVWDGKREPQDIRELCGKCSMIYKWTPEGQLVEYQNE